MYLNWQKNQFGAPSLDRAPSALWNSDVTGTALKVEDTQIFKSNFYLTGMYSRVNGGFQLVTEGGLNSPAVLGRDDIFRNGFVIYNSDRPQTQYKADASNFFNTGSLSHELRFGAGYRSAEQLDDSSWSGSTGFFGNGTPQLHFVSGANHTRDLNKYTSFYLNDTWNFKSFSVNMGVRYDKQVGEDGPSSIDANTNGQGFIPGFQAPVRQIVDQSNFAPRFGFAWSPGFNARTVVRGGYGVYYDQLLLGITHFDSPVQGQTSVRGFPVFDANNALAGFFPPLMDTNAFNTGANRIDPNLLAPRTDELLLSVEHALLPEFVVGVNLTHRRISDILEHRDLIVAGGVTRPATAADFILQGLVTEQPPGGTTVSIPVFTLERPFTYPIGSGTLLTNGGAETEYKGASLTFNKRLANRWMLRGNFTYQDWTWNVPDEEQTLRYPGSVLNQGANGEAVIIPSPLPETPSVFINSKWSYNVNWLYQISPDRPWGFNVAGNVTGRQGYPLPYFASIRPADGKVRNLLAGPPDTVRLDDIRIFDARIEKEFSFHKVGLAIGIDAFNLAGAKTVLQQQPDLSKRLTINGPLEITSPRVFRIGARLTFR